MTAHASRRLSTTTKVLYGMTRGIGSQDGGYISFQRQQLYINNCAVSHHKPLSLNLTPTLTTAFTLKRIELRV